MESWNRLEHLIGKSALETLQKKKVLIVGLGGVGGYAVESLVRSAIGSIVLIDHDVIDISNINRQIIALHSTIGRKKVKVWQERILDISPKCQVVGYDLFWEDHFSELLQKEKPDFVIDACDTIKTKLGIITACLFLKIPFISVMGMGKRSDGSQIKIMDLRDTQYDPLARILRKKIKEAHIKSPIPVVASLEPPCVCEKSVIASCAYVPSIAGLLCTSYIMKRWGIYETN